MPRTRPSAGHEETAMPADLLWSVPSKHRAARSLLQATELLEHQCFEVFESEEQVIVRRSLTTII
eukprot:scaffold536_cov409-Prasinococcus_capsulatus_cf.AAC.11